MREAVIVSAVRTPIGIFNGTFIHTGATALGGIVIAEVVKRAGIDPAEVDEVLMGQALPCGYGQNPAKQAAVKAKLPKEVACTTVNKVCGSSLKTVMLAAQAVQLGDADVVVAGGMENMTMAPYYLQKARHGYRLGPGKIQDSLVQDGLWDIVNNFHMGISNELCSEKYNISREEQDRYAARSYERALAAIKDGLFKKEIVPISAPTRKRGSMIFNTDECARPTSYEQLAKMPPALKKEGLTTAGNASFISDAAAAVVIMAREKAEALGCTIMASIGAQAAAGVDMKYVLVAPIEAVPKVLKKEGIGLDEVDLIEINEAFAGSTCAVINELDLDPAKTNISGGSVALGHPIGASGCRVLVTLIYNMLREEQRVGLASLSLGGGEAVALIIKR